MNKQTLQALEESIQKWEDIINKGIVDFGHKDCALCRIFRKESTNNLMHYTKCTGCPIKKKTGYNMCIETPYTDWDNYFIDFKHINYITRSVHCVKDKKSRELAQDELNFLNSIFDHQ